MSDITIDQLVNATQAAEMCGIQLRSFLYHIRKGHGPKQVDCMGTKGYLRGEVKTWNDARKKPKRGNRK
jgi:predicted DNA-binding transcriptional regulator AlpA